jgi:hypothetical protein
MNFISGLLATGTIAALIQATEFEDNTLLLLKASLNRNGGEIEEGIQMKVQGRGSVDRIKLYH